MPAWLARDVTADGGGEEIDLWTRCAAKAAMRRRRSGARCRVLASADGNVRQPDKSTTTRVATGASGTCERRDGGETQSGDMVAGLPARWRQRAVAVRCCVDSMRIKGAAVMIRIELGGWLTFWIWDGMRLLGTVRKVGRSPENIRWNIRCAVRLWRVSAVHHRMCELGRSAGSLK